MKHNHSARCTQAIAFSVYIGCLIAITSPVFASAPAATSDDLTFDSLDAPVAGPIAPNPAANQELSIPIDLPVIGTVNLIPFSEKDPKTGKDVSGMKVYVPAKGKQLVAGPLIIDQGEFSLVNDAPSYSARATLFGSSATLKIKNATQAKASSEQASSTLSAGIKAPSFSRIVFSISFDSLPTIELIPGKKAILTAVDLILEKNKPIKLLATTTILDQKVVLTFSVTKQSTDVSVTLKNVPFSSLIPSIKGTEAEKIMLTSFKFTAKDLVSNASNKTTYLINGKADVSKLAGLETTDSTQAQDVTLQGSYTAEQGGTFTMTTKSLTLPLIGQIQDAKIQLTTNPVKLKLIGKAHIRFPTIGNFDTAINASITDKGITLAGTIEQTVRFADIDIKNITLHFSTAQKTVQLMGDGQVQGYQARITIAQTAQGAIAAKAALTEKEIKPFGNIPGIANISLKDPQFKFEKKTAGYALAMSGTLNIYGLQLDSSLSTAKTADGQTVTLVKAQAPANWKLSQGMPSLKGTLFDSIQLDQLTFIMSSNQYRDADNDATYEKGINFISKTTLSGPLVPVADFTKTPQTSAITIVGYLAPNPLESTFRASIPNGVVIKNDRVTLGKLELEIAGKPEPIFSLLTTLLVKPSSRDEPLTLTSRISFKGTPPVVSLAGTMQGTWNNPLGFNGFAIGNVAAQIGFGPAFPETGVPSSIGLAGQMALGDRHVAMALKIPIAGDSDIVLCGALDKLTLTDMINAGIHLASKTSSKKISTVELPDIGIENMKLYVAPKATTIGELNFDKGITARGVIVVPGFKAFGNVTVSQSGLIAQASCSEIKYGPSSAPLLLISRAQKDKTCAPANLQEVTKKIISTPPPPAPAMPEPTVPDLLELVDAVDPLDVLDAPPANDNQLPADTQTALKAARSADVACAPDNTVLAEYCGPTMHIILSMEQDLSKQGILVSGLFKVAEIFEEESYFRMDKDGIEFNFLTALGKTIYQGKPLLQTLINGKSSGGLSNPDFNIILEFQQHLIEYVKEQSKAAIAQAKEQVHKGVATAIKESDAKLTQASKDAVAGIDKAKADVQKAQDQLDAINKQIDNVKSSMRTAIENARKNRDSLDKDIATLKQKISDKQKECS